MLFRFRLAHFPQRRTLHGRIVQAKMMMAMQAAIAMQYRIALRRSSAVRKCCRCRFTL